VPCCSVFPHLHRAIYRETPLYISKIPTPTENLIFPSNMALADLLLSSHSQLVKKAVRACHTECYVVATETKTQFAGESPDVIGWTNTGQSILYECKASIEDFLQDQKKAFRINPALGMGDHRYYFTYPGLIHPNRLTESGWGLYELHGRSVIKIKESKIFKSNKVKELELMVSLFRRIGHTIPESTGIIIDNTLLVGQPKGVSLVR